MLSLVLACAGSQPDPVPDVGPGGVDGSPEVALDEVAVVLTGNGNSGWSVALAGDVDGDGQQDLVVGSPSYSPSGSQYDAPGAAQVLLGPVSQDASLNDADGVIVGRDVATGCDSDRMDSAGRHVAGVGDLDGDGLDDLGLSGSSCSVDYVGTVVEACVAPGPALGVSSTADDAACFGGYERAFDACFELGPLVSAGDLDGRGGDDLAVAGRCDRGEGVFVFLGPATLSGRIEPALVLSAENVWALDGPGDLDGDGVSDLLIGGTLEVDDVWQGWVRWVMGPLESDADLRDAPGGIVADDDRWVVSAEAADLDADGNPDLAVGVGASWHSADTESILVFPGPVGEVLSMEDAVATMERVARAVARVPASGESEPDGLLIGSSESGDGGVAYLVYGPLSGAVDLDAAATKLLGTEGSQAGFSVAAGSLGEGQDPALVIGAPFGDGRVYLVAGGL